MKPTVQFLANLRVSGGPQRRRGEVSPALIQIVRIGGRTLPEIGRKRDDQRLGACGALTC
jgi:hypothetical protein